MSDDIKIRITDEYIHISVWGENTYKKCLHGWKELVSTCKKNNRFICLVEGNMDNPLSTMAAFDHGELLREVGIDHTYKVAYADLNPETNKAAKFGETVLHNRGFTMVRIFTSTKEAKEWLLS